MNVLIFGLGLHGGGVGVANYFLKKGETVTITDLKTEEELKSSLERLINTPKLKLTLGRHEYSDIENADLIIKNPAIPPDSPYLKYAEKKSIPVDTDIGIFLDIIREKTNNIVAVTGTRGKSTTSSLIYEVLKRRFSKVFLAGNITISVFDVIDDIKKNSWVVLELSSFQLGGIRKKRYSPPYALITNFYNDHLNYYKSIYRYFEDKKVIYQFQKPGDILTLNRENKVYNMVKANEGVRVYSFGIEPDLQGFGCYVKENTIYFKDENGIIKLISRDLLRLQGEHNLFNVLAAATLTKSIGLETSIIEEAICSFNGLEHRLEYLGKIKGLDVYNDSASTTPEALLSALKTFTGKNITLIMGGTNKSLPLNRLVDELNNNCDIKNLILLEGSGTKRLIDEGLLIPFKVYGSLKEAVINAFKQSTPGTVLLFSPAFASFEMFLNEFDRGKKFKELVECQL